MSPFTWIYPLLILALVGIAVYEHVTASSLLLPLSPALTILTIFLPLLGLGNAFLTARRLLPPGFGSGVGTGTGTPSPTATDAPSSLLPAALQSAQAVLTTVVATLLAAGIVPGPAQDCALESAWQRFWRAHDAQAIRRVQDALDCCGFRTAKDRAWPFPDGDGKGNTAFTCARQFGRDRSCLGPWTEALRRTGGAGLGIVLGVGVLQIASWLLVQYLSRRRRPSWARASKPLPASRSRSQNGQHARLLGAAGEDGNDRAEGEESGSGQGYGSTGNELGPAVEPSGALNESNVWNGNSDEEEVLR